MLKRPRPVTELLSSTTHFHVLLSKAHEQRLLLGRIREALPAPLDQHCHAVLGRQHRLILFTGSPAWASRLRFFSRNLLDQLSKSGLKYERVLVRVMALPAPERRKARPPQRLSAANAKMVAQVAETIDDPLLGAALKRLARHS